MARLKLTSAAVKRIKPPATGQADYFDKLLPSFGLRVSHSGTKSWVVMTRVNGKLIRVTVGRFAAIDLSDAREKARSIIQAAEAGLDPRRIEDERRRKRARDQQNTFEALAEEFMAKHVRPHLRSSTAREYQRILFGADTKPWRARPVSSLEKRDVLDLMESIRARGSRTGGDLALAYLRKFFNWCADREIIASPPTDRIRRLPLRSRDRVLSEVELRLAWRAFDGEGGIFGPFYKLLLLTGQRRGEVAGMRWDEIRDLGTYGATWEIPSTRTKNHRPHLVPLVAPVVVILTSIPRTGPLVFSHNGTTPISGFSKVKTRIDQRIAEKLQSSAKRPILDWTLHDLRRTMVTMMNERLGIAPHVVEAVVNHVSGSARAGVAGVYNRALYLNERREALHRWAELVLGSS
jgi:integrase